jgi:hypothetical protein
VFDRKKALPKKDISLLPEVISGILKAELIKVVFKMGEMIR